MNVLLISLGAALGALCRWQLGVWLNPLLQGVSFGTFFANFAGCFLIGLALGWNLNDSTKLLFITGFLGSFTTFSAFSAEISQKLLNEKWSEGLMVLTLHTVFGIGATVLGIFLGKK